jgi:hypothetical protein
MVQGLGFGLHENKPLTNVLGLPILQSVVSINALLVAWLGVAGWGCPTCKGLTLWGFTFANPANRNAFTGYGLTPVTFTVTCNAI